MSIFAEKEGFHGFQNTTRVLQCWLHYGASLNGWDNGQDDVLWERFAIAMPPGNESTSEFVRPSEIWKDDQPGCLCGKLWLHVKGH